MTKRSRTGARARRARSGSRSLAGGSLADAAGDAQTALALGKMLWSSPQQAAEGVQLLCAAAEAGAVEAVHVLGLACFRGQGVETDLAAARELQRAAANCGLPEAQFELSLLLAQGLGGPVDARGARLWEAKAAAAGHPRACLNRGAHLANSKRPDWAAVARWYARAAAGGNEEAAVRLREMTRLGQTGRRGAHVKRTPSASSAAGVSHEARPPQARHAVKLHAGPRRTPEQQRATKPRTGGDLRFSALLPVTSAPSR
jgi:TPR repeat protein